MSIHYRKSGENFVIFGNTYRYKEEIKSLGGRFVRESRTWVVPASTINQDKLEQLTGGKATSEQVDEQPVTKVASSDLTVVELLEKVNFAIKVAFPRTVWVVGEIQNIALRASAVYLELAESTSKTSERTTTVKAIMWQSSRTFIETRHGREKISELLQDGLKIRCLVQVGFYKERGQISLTIEDIDPAFTKGELALAREKLLKELRQKGLDQKNKQLQLPLFPLRIGLITAKGSRAASDFIDQLYGGNFPGEVLFEDCPTQGEAVEKRTIQALQTLFKSQCDLVVITRGGGSAADLRWYDSRELALCIANAPLPIIAAIGHHEDVSVAEEICCRRQKTPTAAAEFVLELLRQTKERIKDNAEKLAKILEWKWQKAMERQSQLPSRLITSYQNSMQRREAKLEELASHLSHEANDTLYFWQNHFTRLAEKLQRSCFATLERTTEVLGQLEKELIRLDPSPWMERGWTRIMKNGIRVKSIKELQKNDAVSMRLIDGNIKAIIESADVRGDTKQ